MKLNKKEKMSKFELFCMIFFFINADWEKTQDEDLVMFLSDMNPFLFQGEHSADPAIFLDFCNLMPDDITLESSYTLAEKYIASLSADPFYDAERLARAFYTTLQDMDWTEATVNFLTEWRKRTAEESLSE